MPDRSVPFVGGYTQARFIADLLVVAVIAAWWLTSLTLPAGVFPGLGSIGRAVIGLAVSAEFWSNAGITASRILAAVLLATVIGSVIGMLPRYLPWTGGIVDDVLVPFFSSFPGIAWAILGTVWFGVTSKAVLIVQILIILPFALVNVAEGAKAIGSEEVEMGRSFSRRRWAIFWRVELPLLSPFIMASVRISYGVCWKISLIAELFGAHSGIGYLMQLSQDLGEIDRIIAICLFVVAFVIIGERLILEPIARIAHKSDSSGHAKRLKISFLSRG
ncbi:sulfonate transport system permease protein [Rhizobiales bacterium GAS113]|jgi:NitT/TauT family transport system permease protein|nr:sulfonate transport system permease protein [Rhizobiales bacterium GAS113]SEE71334.1 sulfonate transport system permease protein [Rhizobiales bacterium GAS188]